MTVNQKWYHQTVVIILAFLVFWPLGIGLIISRSRASKQGMFVGGLDFKTACIVAAVLHQQIEFLIRRYDGILYRCCCGIPVWQKE